ncbi:MAG TPA: ABC transporter permease [Thermomicrobiales bacterium]|jgi:peptide/nickel transport system permease protein|nr:ABC transporter permease [Thermomicrobiales bacterium]
MTVERQTRRQGAAIAEEAGLERASRGGWRARLRGRQALVVGCGLIAALLLVSLLAPILAPYDPTEIHPIDGLKPPSAEFLLGTDNLGRDILSRIIFAARTSLLVALGSVVVAVAVGMPLGLAAGYVGGKVDSVIMRVLDAILAFPVILLAILVVATLGTRTINLVFTIGFVYIPYFARLVRGNVLALKEREFVEASRAIGAGHLHLVTRDIVPNILSSVIVQASLTMSLAILIEASLSYLGLGVQEPTPAWGSMLQNSQLYLRQAPWFVLAPGICIFLSVLAFNLAGDGLRDALDVAGRRR